MIKVTRLNHPETTPHPQVGGTVAFHETSAWRPKGWGGLSSCKLWEVRASSNSEAEQGALPLHLTVKPPARALLGIWGSGRLKHGNVPLSPPCSPLVRAIKSQA